MRVGFMTAGCGIVRSLGWGKARLLDVNPGA